MSLIKDILPLSHIILDLDVGSKKRLFEQAGLLLENDDGVSRADVFECLFAREKLGSTGLGQGVAIPHGRTSVIKTTLGAFFRLQNPVSFDAPDSKPVSLVFVLLVPENASGQHLEVLSELANKFSVKTIREALMTANSKEEVQAILTADN